MYKLFTVTILRFVSIYFILSVIVAAYFYPGGNIHDPLQIGYSLTHNFLSDLGGYYARSGDVNFLSAFFFNFSMFLFVLVGVGFLFVPWYSKITALHFIYQYWVHFFSFLAPYILLLLVLHLMTYI